jgi:hypothetical protein
MVALARALRAVAVTQNRYLHTLSHGGSLEKQESWMGSRLWSYENETHQGEVKEGVARSGVGLNGVVRVESPAVPDSLMPRSSPPEAPAIQTPASITSQADAVFRDVNCFLLSITSHGNQLEWDAETPLPQTIPFPLPNLVPHPHPQLAAERGEGGRRSRQ